MAGTAVRKLVLYGEPRCPALDCGELQAYLQRRLGKIEVALRGPLLESAIDEAAPAAAPEFVRELARRLAGSKVRSLDAAHDGAFDPLPGEIDYELRRLKNRASGVFGILYDAHELAHIMATVLPASERGREYILNVVLTNQLIGTWDETDRRYHARTVLMGAPAIISLSGLVEAPAKATGYYLARRGAEAWGLAEEQKMELAREFAEECLSHGDERLTEAVKGYVLQVAAYRITGVPFCEDPDCRLYNSHWQRELIRAQLGTGRELCPRHEEIFKSSSERDGESHWTSDCMS